MSRPFAKQTRSTIPPDSDGITPDVAVEVIYGLTLFSLGNEDVALIVTIEVVGLLEEHWERQLKVGGSTDPPTMGNKPKRNRALEILHFTHDELENYKKDSIRAYREKTGDLDNPTMIVWYAEEVIIHALKHNASYVATLPYMLFTYKSENAANLYSLLDSEKSFDYQDFCKRKENFNNHLIEGTQAHPRHWLGDFLTPKSARRNDDKRFVAQPLTDENSKLLLNTLKRWTPPGRTPKIPLRVLLGTFDTGEVDLEDLVRQQVNSDSPHAMERGRMRFLMYPPFLFGVLKAMRLESLTKKADIPLFNLRNRRMGQGDPPIDRNNLPSLNQGRRAVIRKQLDKRKIGRGPISRKTLVAEVRGENRLTIPFDEPKTAQMRLYPGESIIKLKCRDRKGYHPLDVHFISWEETPDQSRSQRYVTVLEDGRKVELNVSFKTDLAGNPIEALVDFDYTYEPSRQHIAARARSFVVGFAQWPGDFAKTLSALWRDQFAAYIVPASCLLAALIILTQVMKSEKVLVPVGEVANLSKVTPSLAEAAPSREGRNISRGRESKGGKLSSADNDDNLRAQYENAIFLYAEGEDEVTNSDEKDDKWHVAVKRNPRKSAASVRNVKVRVVDPTTGDDVAVSRSEDGRVALPVLRAGTYEVTVNRQGVKFSQTVDLPLDAGTYVELKKETTTRKANR